jgi:hypothetical protein
MKRDRSLAGMGDPMVRPSGTRGTGSTLGRGIKQVLRGRGDPLLSYEVLGPYTEFDP